MFKILLILTLTWPVFSLYASYELEGIIHNQEDISKPEIFRTNEEEINQEAIQVLNASSSSLDDIFRVSPVATTARGPRSSGESPQIRGLDDGKIFVKIDGARQNFQADHNSMIPIDMDTLKSVRVSKSSANISDSSSIGGGVSFVTKDAKDFLKSGKEIGSEFKTSYHSANAEKSLNGKFIYQNKKKSGYISTTITEAENLKLSNGETLDYSSYEDKSILIKNQIGRFGFKADIFERKDDSPIDPSLDPPERIRSLFSDNKMTRTNLSLDYKKKNLKVLGYLNQIDSEKKEKVSGLTKVRKLKTYGTRIDQSIDDFSFGGEYYQDNLSSSFAGEDIYSYPEASGNNYFLFGEKAFRIGSRMILTPGLKWNAYELSSAGDLSNQSGGALTKNVMLKNTWTEAFKSTLSYSEGYNAPRVNEVYPSGLHSQGDDFFIRDNFFIPNEDLKAESSVQKEIELSYSNALSDWAGIYQVKLSAYENQVKDYIYLERIDRSIIDDSDGTTQFVNIPNVVLWGGELEAKLLFESFETSLSYSKVRGKNQSKKLYLEDLPADQYNLNVNYYNDRNQFRLGYLGQYSLEQHRVNPETIQRTDKTESYVLHNIYATKQLRNFQINFRIDNLTNKKYRKHASHLYEAGTDYKLGILYKINTL